MDTQGIEVAAVTEETAEDIAEREAEKERRTKQARGYESAAIVAMANTIIGMAQFKSGKVSKIAAGSKYDWRGEAEIMLPDGFKLKLTIEAEFPDEK